MTVTPSVGVTVTPLWPSYLRSRHLSLSFVQVLEITQRNQLQNSSKSEKLMVNIIKEDL